MPLELCRVATEEGKAKFSQQFALNKQAQRVDYNPNQETADPEPETPSGGNGGGGNNPPGELEE